MNAALLWKLLGLACTFGTAWLLTYAVHSTVLIGGVWAATRVGVLRSLRVRDLAWRTALVGGLFTATLQLLVGHQPWGGSTELTTPGVPAASVVADALRSTVEETRSTRAVEVPGAGVPEGSTPPPTSVAVVYRPREKRLVVDVPPAPGPLATTNVPATLWRPSTWRPSTPLSSRGLRPASLAFLAWALVASALLLRLAVRRARVLAALRDRVPVADPLVRARLLGLCRDVQHARVVKLTTAAALLSPVALGWGEICLPTQALLELDGAQQRSVLAHELAHLRRLDPLWLVLASVLEQLFFFQPLNRLARARMQEVAEYLCDDWAAARDGSGLSVAQGLASVAAWLDGRESIVPLAGMAERPSQLLTRVQRLLQRGAGEVERLRAWHVITAVMLLGVTVLAAPGVRAAPEQGPLAARRGQPRPTPQADAGAVPERTATRAMVAVQAIDSSLLESAGSVSSDDAPAAKDAAPAPAPERTPATERKHEGAAPDSGTHRTVKPSRTEDAAPGPRSERAQGSAPTASATATGTPTATSEQTESAATDAAPATSAGTLAPSVTSPRVVAALSGTRPIIVTASVPPVPPVPAVAPAPPVPPMPPGASSADVERMRRDAQRLAQDAQRRAQDAVRRAQARSRGHRKGRHAERTPADPKTVDALISALKDSDPGVRQAAAESLGRIGDARAIEPLGGLMGDSTLDVRRAAVEALGNLDDPKVIPPLTRATGDANPAVRREAAEALLGIDDEAATAPLVKLLSDSDPRVRVTALEGLSRRGDRRALEPLGKLVKDPNVEVRSRAVRALARFKDPASQSALVTALKDENAEVRAAAAEALGELELKSAPQGLLDATRDPNAEVRQAVAEALGQIHDSKAVPQLRALLDDASADVRSAAVEALSEIRDSTALQALITAMQSKDVTVRRAAAQALGQRE